MRIGSTIKITDPDGAVLQENHQCECLVGDYEPPGWFDWLLGYKKPKYEEKTCPLRIIAIETFNKTHEEATQGQEVALLLRGVTFKPEKGMLLVRGDSSG